jgi:hypothetical protein
MTTIITRLFADTATAQAAAHDLMGRGHGAETIGIITREGDSPASDRMRAWRVSAASTAAYAPHVAKGKALLVVQAPFNPVGTARDAIKALARHPALDAGVSNENDYIREEMKVETSGKVQRGTVFYMSNPHRSSMHGHIMGQNPIITGKTKTSAIPGGGHMSTKFWPMKLLSAPKERSSAISGGFLFSSMFGIPTIVSDWPSREMMTKI